MKQIRNVPANYFSERPALWTAIRLPLRFLAGLWLIHAVQIVFEVDFAAFGILPRHEEGLKGIIFAPVLHADWGHLMSNSLPFLIFSTVINYFFPSVAKRVFWVIYLVTGVLVWCLAKISYHIGASYLVYGMAAFIFFTGIFRRSIRSVILSLLIMTFYGGLVAGVLPSEQNAGISWESHLLGAIVGLCAAYWYRNDFEADEVEPEDQPEPRDESYFAADTFDKTKAERQAEAEAEARRQAEALQNLTNQNTNNSGWFFNDTRS